MVIRPPAKIALVEFIGLIAMMAATVAFSIDAMLPALTQIAVDLAPPNPNQVQLIIGSFVLGLGAGTLLTGPLSDALGRRAVIFGGMALYCASAIFAGLSENLTAILIARAVQGLGAAGPRVVGMAIVRDLYSGTQMARILSFVMVVFTLVPVFAPLLGAGIVLGFGWRGIFAAFVLFAMINTLWMALRQRETLAPEHRRPFRLSTLWAATQECLGHPLVRLSILAQTFGFAQLYLVLFMVQPVFETAFDRGDSFPMWFAGIAAFSALGGVLNAMLVERLGMRQVVQTAFGVQILCAAAILWATQAGVSWLFPVFILWVWSVFFQAGLTIGNLNAIGMTPMGHIAGSAASIIAGMSTIGAVLFAAPFGQMFDGTPRPLALGVLIFACLAFGLTRRMIRHEQVALA